MDNRGRDIAKMMGYENTESVFEAVGQGDLLLVKLDDAQKQSVSEWLHKQISAVESEDELLAATLHDIADSVELALELKRYPADIDICEMELPHGWPSYCERSLLD